MELSNHSPWALAKEGPIHEVKNDHEDPKSQKEGKIKKEKIIIIKEEDSDVGHERDPY